MASEGKGQEVTFQVKLKNITHIRTFRRQTIHIEGKEIKFLKLKYYIIYSGETS